MSPVRASNGGRSTEPAGENGYFLLLLSPNPAADDNGHGTHCSGTIGGVGNNGIGVAGVNWNVKIVPLKFLSAGGSGSTADAVLAIQNQRRREGIHPPAAQCLAGVIHQHREIDRFVGEEGAQGFCGLADVDREDLQALCMQALMKTL